MVLHRLYRYLLVHLFKYVKAKKMELRGRALAYHAGGLGLFPALKKL